MSFLKISEPRSFLRQTRMRKKLSKSALAQKAGVDRQTIIRLESEESTHQPSLNTLTKVCRVLGIIHERDLLNTAFNTLSGGANIPAIQPTVMLNISARDKVKMRETLKRHVKRLLKDFGLLDKVDAAVMEEIDAGLDRAVRLTLQKRKEEGLQNGIQYEDEGEES